MPLFEVKNDSKQVAKVAPTSFPALKLWERQDLEAWVLSAPELAGGEFQVVTSEFDRFDKTSERLDVLGIVKTAPGHGRLVVVELKRDGVSTTVDLQAVKYAAYVASVQFADVVDMYARYHEVPDAESKTALLELLEGTEDEVPIIDDTPRIVLLAEDFRPEVTTTVLWLLDNFNVDIRCVRLQPFQVGDRILVNSEAIIPLPEAEQYRLGVQRKRQEVEREQDQRARARRLLPQLIETGALELGQPLYFRRDAIPPDKPWDHNDSLFVGKLVESEGNRTLQWVDPDSGQTLLDSPSLQAARILNRLGLKEGPVTSAGVNGMHYWTVDGEISLKDLGKEAGLLESTSRHIDRARLRKACEEIPSGRWTAYGDLAAAIGVAGAAQSVAGVIATDPSIPNAHRVLRASGRISPGWTASDGGGPEVARRRLDEEGMPFDESNCAAPTRRWRPPEEA